METTTRYNEVMKGVKKIYKRSNEVGKDNVVKMVKRWLKINPSTDDQGKKEAFQCFLADLNIY